MGQGNSFLELIKENLYNLIFQKSHRIGKNSFTRKRKLEFPMVFSTVLKLVTRSLGIECEWLEPDPARIPPSKQAFSKARYKISHTGFKELLDISLDVHYADPSYGTWRGYRIIGADGSSLRLPESEEIINEYGRFKCNATGGRQPILARVSLFVDLCTSVIVSARMAGWNTGEQTMAEEQLPELLSCLKKLGQQFFLFVYDRGYPSLKFIDQHYQLGADFLFRLQRGMFIKLWDRIKSGETDFIFELTGKKGVSGHKVRVIVITLPNGEQEVLLTSLFDREKFPLADLGRIYFQRWHIEECYKRLKISTELENFSGINLEAVLQEFWAHLVMCNTLALYMCDRQGFLDPDNIPEYRLNFSILFGCMREKLQKVIIGKLSPKKFQAFFDRAALRAKVKVQPGRSYSRHMVGKPLRHHVFRRVC